MALPVPRRRNRCIRSLSLIALRFCHAQILRWSLLAARHPHLRLRTRAVPKRSRLGVSPAQSRLSARLPLEPKRLAPYPSPKKRASPDAYPPAHSALHHMGSAPLSSIRRCRLPTLRSAGSAVPLPQCSRLSATVLPRACPQTSRWLVSVLQDVSLSGPLKTKTSSSATLTTP